MASGPFIGVRVLDLGRTLAGAHAATFLADLGADVISIEQPGSISKSAGIPGRMAGGVNAAYNFFARNKKCITLNLRHQQGKDIFYRLVKDSDVVVENYRPEVARAQGLDYESLRKVNPRIICCSITGYGSSGPNRDRLCWDVAAQAVSGLMSLTGEAGGEPCIVSAPIIDVGTAMNGAMGIMAALFHREKTGKGQEVAISLIETAVHFLAWFPTHRSAGGELFPRQGSSTPIIAVNGAFKTKSGYLHVSCLHQRHWENLCRLMERPDLLADPKFADEGSRLKNKPELLHILQDILLARSLEEWMEILDGSEVVVAPVNDVGTIIADPQVQHLNLLVDMMSVEGKPIKMVRLPFNLSEFPELEYRTAPGVGDDTEKVLRELAGVSPEEMEALRREGVVSAS